MDRPKHVDLTDIVYQGEQPPLYIHFPFGTQGEAIHVFMYTNVGKDRFHYPQPPRIDLLARFAVDLGFHKINQVRLTRVHLNRKIPARSIRLAQTARAQRTGRAVFGSGMIDIIGAVAIDLVAGMTFQFLSVRAKIDTLAFIISKISRAERTRLGICLLLIFETLLLGKTRIACAVLDVGDVSIDLFILADLQAVERVIVGIGGQLPALKIGFIFSDGGDIFFAPFNIGLRFS